MYILASFIPMYYLTHIINTLNNINCMKKVLSIVMLAGLVVFGTSCSKKYDCTCTDYASGATTVEKIGGANKDAAQVTCVAKTNTTRACAITN
ncbi:hypothetical protein CAP35_13625 [Chitinophagaceae bacterium IBVUCB1]|nr:hypothetical protein CAP35_13625 [Chitinophagaceae bacterium IBVUCB1]